MLGESKPVEQKEIVYIVQVTLQRIKVKHCVDRDLDLEEEEVSSLEEMVSWHPSENC